MSKTTVNVSNSLLTFKHKDQQINISLVRTLRLPEDGKTHALPPGLGHFPLKRIEDYRDKVPEAWREHGGVFFPMWQREAMWLSFGPSPRSTFALKVASGKVNAVSGGPWSQELVVAKDGAEQDYLVAPPQPWLDGFNTGKGQVSQFVAMPLGMGYTVEKQVTGKEDVGGIQILAVPPKKGKIQRISEGRGAGMSLAGGAQFMGASPAYSAEEANYVCMDMYSGGPMTKSLSANPITRSRSTKSAEMGLAQGGKMTQKIYPDPHGIDVWDQGSAQRIFIHIVNSELYEQITGEKAPPTPITAQHYTEKGYPWFELWDQEMGDVGYASSLAGLKTVADKDKEHGFEGQQDDSPTGEKKVVSAGKVSPAPTIKEGAEW